MLAVVPTDMYLYSTYYVLETYMPNCDIVFCIIITIASRVGAKQLLLFHDANLSFQ